jgi:hypothetical protein
MTQPDPEDMLLFEIETPDASKGAYIIFMDGDYYDVERRTASHGDRQCRGPKCGALAAAPWL